MAKLVILLGLGGALLLWLVIVLVKSLDEFPARPAPPLIIVH